MIQGLMQPFQLQISTVLRYAAAAHARREIVSRQIEGPIWRYDYRALAERAARAAHMLTNLGVRPGDRVSSLAWNTHRHLELFYAAPGFGAVLHTANPRLFDDQIIYTINHAESAVLLFESNLLAVVERLQERPPGRFLQYRHHDEEGDDGPDHKPEIGLKKGFHLPFNEPLRPPRAPPLRGKLRPWEGPGSARRAGR